MKKLRKLVLEICYAFHFARKWHCGFRSALQFVRCDNEIQKQIQNKIGF